MELKPEQERVIGSAIQAGLISKADDVVEVGIEAIRQRLQSRAGSGSELDTEQWLSEFKTWVHSHSTPRLHCCPAREATPLAGSRRQRIDWGFSS